MIKLKSLINESKSLVTEATRSMIGIEEPNGKITATYCHYDGYPEGVGKMLKKFYKNPSVIKELVTLGKQGISTLGKNIGKKHDFDMPYDEKEKLGYTTFYGRDRGEKGNMQSKYKDMQDYEDNFDSRSGAEYGYVWSLKDKKWHYYSSRGHQGIL